MVELAMSWIRARTVASIGLYLICQGSVEDIKEKRDNNYGQKAQKGQRQAGADREKLGCRGSVHNFSFFPIASG